MFSMDLFSFIFTIRPCSSEIKLSVNLFHGTAVKPTDKPPHRRKKS